MIEICQLEVSTVYLLKEQTYKGRCVVTLNQHETELFQLSKEELNLYMKDVANVANAINQAFGPDKINYAIFGDLVPHIHFHLVPKYKDGKYWGKAYEDINKDKKILSDKEYKIMIGLIKDHLS